MPKSVRERSAAQRDPAAVLESKVEAGAFDVFLCHNHLDKPQVKKIGLDLKEIGILPWLDEWELRPGLPWQDALEENINRVKSAAVFVGKDGVGPWQNQEVKAFLRKFVEQKSPVIPVLLTSAPDELPLPIFLLGMTYVDFRVDDPDPMHQLVWGITGERSYSALEAPKRKKKSAESDERPARPGKKRGGRPKTASDALELHPLDAPFPDLELDEVRAEGPPPPAAERPPLPPRQSIPPTAFGRPLQETLIGTWQVQIVNPFGMVGEMMLDLGAGHGFQGRLQTPMGLQMVEGQWQLSGTQLLLQGVQTVGPQQMPYTTLIQLKADAPLNLSMQGVTSAGEQTTWRKIS